MAKTLPQPISPHMIHDHHQHHIGSPSLDDEILGAYFISSLCNRCEQCGTTQTPQWRKGWYSKLLNRAVILCNACGLKYSKYQYCPYCNYIYYKGEDWNSKYVWISCDNCPRWVHVDCEKKHKHGTFYYDNKYLCPTCTRCLQF